MSSPWRQRHSLRCLAAGKLKQSLNLPISEVTKEIRHHSWQAVRKLSGTPRCLAAHQFQARYEFQKQPDPLDVDMIIRTLTELT